MFRKNPLLVGLLFLLVISLFVAACAGAEQPAPEDEGPALEEPAPAEPEPAERKVTTFIFTQEFDSLGPMYTGMWFSEITQQIWNCSPWDWDEANNPRPVLLTELPTSDNGGISADGRTLTLKLRDDIVWSDGTPITSADFLFTYEMYLDPANTVNSTYPYDVIESIEAPDDRTVVVTFPEPFVPWAATLYQPEFLPEHVLRPVFEAEGNLDGAAWNLAPTVGCGPYVFEEWETGSFARFVRNDNYYGPAAKIDEIFIRFVPDDAAQIAALQTGEGDLGTFIAYSDMPTLEDAGVDVIMVSSGYDEGWFFYFGEEAHPSLSDVRVRQAVAMCFDRFSLNEDLLLGKTVPATTWWDLTPYANPDLEPWPYDPDRANALLDEAGWVDSNGDGVRDKDGEELILVHGTTTREVRADTQAVAQQQLADCGIQLEIQSYSSDIFFGTYGEGAPLSNGELDIGEFSSREAFPDPDENAFLCAEVPSDEFPDGVNDQHLCDPKLDELFEFQQTQVDFAERQQTIWEIGEYMFENVYWLGIWQDPDNFAIGDRLTNVSISGVTPFYNIYEWDLK